MGNSQSLPKSRKRSNSESHMEPSKKYYYCESYNVCLSDDELPNNEYSPTTNTKGPSSADYTSTMEEIIEKSSQLSLLFSEVNQRASKFRNKLKTQRCTLKVLQNAFTFNNDLLDTTINTLKIWKEELANTGNKWEQDFDISLIVSVTENGKSAEDVTFNGIKEPNNSNSSFHQSQSSKHEKRKKCRLNLKRSLESEKTDDGMTEDSKENLACLAVKSTLKDEKMLLELEDDSKPEILEVPNKVHETEQNDDVPVIPETVALDVDAEDSDHGSRFSGKTTVILNFDELQTTKSLLENIKTELDSCSDEFTKTQIDLVVTEAKIYFFDELGLYSNVVGVSADHVKEEDTEIKQENQDSSKNFEDAVKLLREDDSSLFDSDLDTSVTSVSDEEEEEENENKIKKDDEDIAGLISKDFPLLPKEAITVTNDSDKEMILNEDDVDTEGDDKDHEYQIKSCTVVLDSASENPELRLIERYLSEGMEEAEFAEARDNLAALEKDYQDGE